MLKYAILFIAALISSLILTPLVRSGARRLRAMDLPGKRKIHTRPIPRLGGFAIFISFYLVLLIFSQFGYFHFPEDFFEKVNLGWLLGASAIILGLGAVDDFRRMSPSFKFLLQIVAGLVVALTCRRIEVINLPLLWRS